MRAWRSAPRCSASRRPRCAAWRPSTPCTSTSPPPSTRSGCASTPPARSWAATRSTPNWPATSRATRGTRTRSTVTHSAVPTTTATSSRLTAGSRSSASSATPPATTPQSAKKLVDDLQAGRDVTPTRGPDRLCTWKQANRILAGFGDGHAAEGPSAGPASLVGLKLAKERGWTAPDESGSAKPEASEQVSAAEKGRLPAQHGAAADPGVAAGGSAQTPRDNAQTPSRDTKESS